MPFCHVTRARAHLFSGAFALPGSHCHHHNGPRNGAARSPRHLRRAWTLLELLVVFAVLSVILALGLTILTRVREQANQLKCRSNLKDLALAVHSYHAAHGHMPPYASGRRKEIYGSWFVHLLPEVEQEAVYQDLATGQRTHHDGIQTFTDGRYLPGVYGVRFPELLCPSDPTHISSHDAPTNYLANWYAFTDDSPGLYRPAQRFNDLTDGLTHVVLFAEAYSQCGDLPRLALYSDYYHNFGVTQHGLASDDPYYAPKDYTMFQVRPVHCDKWRCKHPTAKCPWPWPTAASGRSAQASLPRCGKNCSSPKAGRPTSDLGGNLTGKQQAHGSR